MKQGVLEGRIEVLMVEKPINLSLGPKLSPILLVGMYYHACEGEEVFRNVGRVHLWHTTPDAMKEENDALSVLRYSRLLARGGCRKRRGCSPC